jgi:hypothetical protein
LLEEYKTGREVTLIFQQPLGWKTPIFHPYHSRLNIYCNVVQTETLKYTLTDNISTNNRHWNSGTVRTLLKTNSSRQTFLFQTEPSLTRNYKF